MPCMGAANTSGVRLVARTATQRRHSDGFRTKLMNQLFTKVGFGTWLMVPPEQPCLCSETASDKALLRVRLTRWNAKWSLGRYPTDGKIFTEVWGRTDHCCCVLWDMSLDISWDISTKNKIWENLGRKVSLLHFSKFKQIQTVFVTVNGNWHWHWCYFCTRFLLCFVIVKSRTSITTLIYGKCKHLESRTNIYSYI